MMEPLKHFALPHFRWTNITIGFDMNLFFNLYFKFSIYLFIYFKCLAILKSLFISSYHIIYDWFWKMIIHYLLFWLWWLWYTYLRWKEFKEIHLFFQFRSHKLRRKCNDSAGNSCLSLWFNLLSQNLAVGKRLGKAGEKGWWPHRRWHPGCHKANAAIASSN